ncbi:hypothetical protein [uncultured Brevundimonas sp.]|uniref:hypothetical protein n=1 Tax=uncultured Brevundimonas sp. TaxID=213418 RepID=UPI0030EE48B4
MTTVNLGGNRVVQPPAKWDYLAMWSLLRIVIISLAFVGFLGQTEARATPFSVASLTQDMAHCAEMAVGPTDAAPTQKQTPCSDMTADCIAKMGCAVVSPVFSNEPSLDQPASGLSPSYGGVTERLTGIVTAPPRAPPKTEA